ncbi:MAG: DNA-directed DNA polymerase II small subunit [archaeon]
MSESLQRALRSFVAGGYQLQKDAFEFLSLIAEEDELEALVSITLRQLMSTPTASPIVTKEVLETTALKIRSVSPQSSISLMSNLMATSNPFAREISSDIEIVNDPSKKIGSAGGIEDFTRYFRSRFRKIQDILRERLDTKGAVSIDSALRSKQASVSFICMVAEKREQKKHVLLTVEDEESQVTVLIPMERDECYRAAQAVPLDQVIYIEAKKGKGDLLLCERLVLPDIPERKGSKSNEPVCAALLSDVHVGSKKFMKDSFEQVMLWLNCRLGDPRQRDLASRVKYVIVAGDLVDGVGIYPNQEEELAIADVYSQYRLAAQYIEQIPDYIEVILIPGNHEPVRQSLPQPAVASKFAEPVYNARAIRSLGNPSEVTLHGVRFLLYHGRSLDDVITAVPGMTFSTPHLAMEHILRCRHLAPEYGNRTSIAPESNDYLVIENVPDVFHAGHVHINGAEKYRGTTIVNSGSWQEQTDYQRRMGVRPTPGILPVVDLQSMEITPIKFTPE